VPTLSVTSMARINIPEDKKNLYAKIAKWAGVVASVCAGVLFVFRVVASRASIKWNSSNFIDDSTSKLSWRANLFSFSPSTFVDVWTPFVFCVVGLSIHVEKMPFKVKSLQDGWGMFCVFHSLMAFYGGIGYAGNVGIILGSIQFACAFVILGAVILCDGETSLKLPNLTEKIKMRVDTDGSRTDMFSKIVAWISMISSCLVLIVGLFRICASGAHVAWNNNNATFDTNSLSWRMTLFSFDPNILADAWTPIIMGLVGIVFHLKNAPTLVEPLSKTYWRLFWYHLTMGLFGCIGYAGNLGIICSVVVFIACLLQLIAAVICGDKKPCLDLQVEGRFGVRGENNNENVDVGGKV